MPTRIGIEWRDAHETMHAFFRLQIPVGVVPVDEERRTLDARLIAGQQICRDDGKAVALRPPAVHAQKHLRPVLRLRAACARVQRENRIVRVIRAGQEDFELQFAHGSLDGLKLRLHFRLKARIIFFQRHFKKRLCIVRLGDDLLVLVDASLDRGKFLIDLLRLFRIVPEGRLTHLVFEFGYLFFLSGDVKVNPPFP